MNPESSDAAMIRSARRVGDRQRGEYAETLADAFARGELSRTEFEARAELCLTAVTDADLARLIADLQDRRTDATSSESNGSGSSRADLRLATIVAFEFVLIVTAYALGVDLEGELRSWYLIAFEIWLVGTVAGAAGAAGALLLRSTRTSRPVD